MFSITDATIDTAQEKWQFEGRWHVLRIILGEDSEADCTGSEGLPGGEMNHSQFYALRRGSETPSVFHAQCAFKSFCPVTRPPTTKKGKLPY